jgi:hypothetical protein
MTMNRTALLVALTLLTAPLASACCQDEEATPKQGQEAPTKDQQAPTQDQQAPAPTEQAAADDQDGAEATEQATGDQDGGEATEEATEEAAGQESTQEDEGDALAEELAAPPGFKNIPSETYEEVQETLGLSEDEGVDLIEVDGQRLALRFTEEGGALPSSARLALLKGKKVVSQVDARGLFSGLGAQDSAQFKSCQEWGGAIFPLSTDRGAVLRMTCTWGEPGALRHRELVSVLTWEAPPTNLEGLRPAWVGLGGYSSQTAKDCQVGQRSYFALGDAGLQRSLKGFAMAIEEEVQGEDDPTPPPTGCESPGDKEDTFNL